MNEFSKYVGFDVHKATIAVSVADRAGGEPRFFGEIANTPAAITKLTTRLAEGGAGFLQRIVGGSEFFQPAVRPDLAG